MASQNNVSYCHGVGREGLGVVFGMGQRLDLLSDTGLSIPNKSPRQNIRYPCFPVKELKMMKMRIKLTMTMTLTSSTKLFTLVEIRALEWQFSTDFKIHPATFSSQKCSIKLTIFKLTMLDTEKQYLKSNEFRLVHYREKLIKLMADFTISFFRSDR